MAIPHNKAFIAIARRLFVLAAKDAELRHLLGALADTVLTKLVGTAVSSPSPREDEATRASTEAPGTTPALAERVDGAQVVTTVNEEATRGRDHP